LRSVEIVKVMESSVLISLGNNIKALLHQVHLADGGTTSLANSKTKSKYKEGVKLDAVRVLTVDVVNRKCYVTAKKSLVGDSKKIISGLGALEVNDVGTGFVSQVVEQGVVVTFYGNAYGFVSAKLLAEEMGVEDPRVNYKIGDVVKARVVGKYMRKVSERSGAERSGVEWGGGGGVGGSISRN